MTRHRGCHPVLRRWWRKPLVLWTVSTVVSFLQVFEFFPIKTINYLIKLLAVLISGGVGTNQKSAEIYIPVTNSSCSLPELPNRRFFSTQSGDLLCGGGSDTNSLPNTREYCITWSLNAWSKSHISLLHKRYGHSSWVTRSGTYLIGGTHSPRTSELVHEDGSVENGFSLKHNAR